ncbi:MAG: DNA polymerase III subunit gamma/tau [Caldisericia bacterium]
MEYITLYRKYRPKDFSEIKGQEHITKILINTLEKNMISHAYLFSGPKGTGKTTVARIFAKGLNCDEGITSKPCNKCKNCLSINEGTNIDVIEIDGASNRGIDEVRSLKERVSLSPTFGRYRVFIIDESHMLTQEAFNALLKTLEEPPQRTVIILATTDPQKLPLTIISRCIRFNFKRIGIEDLVDMGRIIANNEKISISDDVLYKLAEASDGSLRDFISLLEQLILFSGEKIELENLLSLFGESEDRVYKDFYINIYNGEDAKILSMVGELINSGKEVQEIVKGIITYGRKILIKKIFEEEIENEIKLLKKDFIIDVIDNMIELFSELRYSNFPRFMFEIKTLKLVLKYSKTKGAKTFEEEIQLKEVEEERQPQSIQERSFIWDDFLLNLKNKNKAIYSIIKFGKFIDIKDDKIFIQFPFSSKFHKEMIEEKRDFLRNFLSELGYKNYDFSFSLQSEEDYIKEKEKIEKSEEVSTLFKYFDGKVERIEENPLDSEDENKD